MAETFDLLTTVKNALGITGDYQDATLSVLIDDINGYLRSAGVPESLINTSVSAGTVARGVADIWNYGSGDGQLSSYFYQRVIQLASTRTSATVQPSVPDEPDTPPTPDEPDQPNEPTIVLPDGYVQLEYVIANPVVGSTVYLDTGVTPTANTGADYTIEPSAIALNGSHSLSSNCVFMATLQPSQFLLNRFGVTAVIPDVPRVGTKYHIQSFVNGNVAKINEYSVPVNAGSSVSSVLMLGCFGGAIADSSYWFSGKIYELKFYEADELIKHFVPAQRGSDGKVGFYELVGDAFYSSSGTGDYQAGAFL